MAQPSGRDFAFHFLISSGSYLNSPMGFIAVITKIWGAHSKNVRKMYYFLQKIILNCHCEMLLKKPTVCVEVYRVLLRDSSCLLGCWQEQKVEHDILFHVGRESGGYRFLRQLPSWNVSSYVGTLLYFRCYWDVFFDSALCCVEWSPYRNGAF